MPKTPKTRADTPAPARGEVDLVIGPAHLQRVVLDGMLEARTSLEIATADLKAMRVPLRRGRRAASIIAHLRRLAAAGVEVRVLHSGVPSGPTLAELRRDLPGRLILRRCPRMHAKIVIIDSQAMYIGSANLTGAGLGAKSARRRNVECGVWTRSPQLIDAAMEEFNTVWEGRLCTACRRKPTCPVPLEEPRLGAEKRSN